MGASVPYLFFSFLIYFPCPCSCWLESGGPFPEYPLNKALPRLCRVQVVILCRTVGLAENLTDSKGKIPLRASEMSRQTEPIAFS